MRSGFICERAGRPFASLPYGICLQEMLDVFRSSYTRGQPPSVSQRELMVKFDLRGACGVLVAIWGPHPFLQPALHTFHMSDLSRFIHCLQLLVKITAFLQVLGRYGYYEQSKKKSVVSTLNTFAALFLSQCHVCLLRR